MPKIYLRLKHFVASYMRCHYGKNPEQPGTELHIDTIPGAMPVLMRVQINAADKVVPNCFCERQWQRMSNGERITHSDQSFMTVVRDSSEWLTETEVADLSGVHQMRGEDMGDYVCIAIPNEVEDPRTHTSVRTNGQWQLMHDAALKLMFLLEDEFDSALIKYIDDSLKQAKDKKQERYFRDALELFMNHNQIRNCEDNREKKTLMRRYYRAKDRKAADALTGDDEFYTGRERSSQATRKSNLSKRVFCIELDTEYESLHDAARANGLSYDALRKSVKRGYRCNGKRFVLK